MTEREAMPWVALLGLMVDGPVSEREPSIRGMVRSVDPTTADSDGRARVWRDGILARVENPSGRPMLIVGSERAWRFGERQAVPPETASVEARTNFHGAGLLWRRPAQSFLGNDFTRPTGPAWSTRLLDRPAWEVELAPPSHKSYPIQLVVDAETGIVVSSATTVSDRSTSGPSSSLVSGWVQLSSRGTGQSAMRVKRATPSTGLTWRNGGTGSPNMWPRSLCPSAWKSTSTCTRTTRRQGHSKASIEFGGVGTLARRPRSSKAWNLHWQEIQHRRTDDKWDWALSMYHAEFSEQGFALLRQHLGGASPTSA